MKKLIAIALLVASTGAAALPQGQQAEAIYRLAAFGTDASEAVAIQELGAEEQRIAILTAEASALSANVDYYNGEVDRLNALLTHNNEVLRHLVPLNNSRPQGSPVWSRSDWYNYNRNRGFIMAAFGISANVIAEEARIQAENDEARELITVAEGALFTNQAGVTERLAEVSQIEQRRGYGGTRPNGGSCIVFGPGLGFQAFYCP